MTTTISHEKFEDRVRAAFVPPGTFLVAISGRLNSLAVDRLIAAIATAPPEARELLVSLTAVTEVDPAGAAHLWLWCDRQGANDRRVRLMDLPPTLAHLLQPHPLGDYFAGDALFQDPFATLAPSGR